MAWECWQDILIGEVFKMKVVIANPPWIVNGRYGVRATSRWPHLRNDKILVFPCGITYVYTH